jgi:hypothetical protein
MQSSFGAEGRLGMAATMGPAWLRDLVLLVADKVKIHVLRTHIAGKDVEPAKDAAAKDKDAPAKDKDDAPKDKGDDKGKGKG